MAQRASGAKQGEQQTEIPAEAPSFLHLLTLQTLYANNIMLGHHVYILCI